jgi:hypothetical protein
MNELAEQYINLLSSIGFTKIKEDAVSQWFGLKNREYGYFRLEVALNAETIGILRLSLNVFMVYENKIAEVQDFTNLGMMTIEEVVSLANKFKQRN